MASKASKDKDQILNESNDFIKSGLARLLISIGVGGTNPVITFWIFIWKFVPGVSKTVSRIGIPFLFYPPSVIMN